MKRQIACLVVLLLLVPMGVRAQSLAEDPRVAEVLELLEIWMEAQVAYEGLPDALQRQQWIPWNIDLAGTGAGSSAADQRKNK